MRGVRQGVSLGFRLACLPTIDGITLHAFGLLCWERTLAHDDYKPALQAIVVNECPRGGGRKTWIETEDGKRDCRALYDAEAARIDYPVFRTRLRSLEQRGISITQSIVRAAALLDKAAWRVTRGGGRSRSFCYQGDLHPEIRGKHPSIASFLRKIGRYDDRDMLRSRLRGHWDVDDALREPVQLAGQPGYIYLLTNELTGLSYVGLSVNAPAIRWGQHRRESAEGSGTPLHAAMREYGDEAFRVETIELVEEGEDLGARERHWIAELRTLVPGGYNVREGGQMGRAEGISVLWEGRNFSSIAAMCREVSRETGLAVHVIESRYREGCPLPEKARTHSGHPEAGSPLFRQWQGMKKRAAKTGAGVAEVWLNYDAWKSDIAKLAGNGRLTRVDETRPWEPGNCVRLERREIVRRTHGQAFTALGQTWATKQDALDAYGIPRNTFDLRLRAGFSVNEALTQPLGPTSKAPVTVDGECFESRNQACMALSVRYGMTPDQVKDYLVRKVPTAEWPKHGQHVRSGPGVPLAYEVDGVRYASEMAMCRAFGIPSGTFQKRRRNGMTVEAALKMPVRDAVLVIFGFEWPSAKAACAAFGLPHSTYRARVGKHGMTPEAALMTATSRGYAGIDRPTARTLCGKHGCVEVDG